MMTELTRKEKAKEFLKKNKQLPCLYDIDNPYETYKVFVDDANDINCVVLEYVPKYYYGVFSTDEKKLDEAYGQFFTHPKVLLGAVDGRVCEYYKKYGFFYDEMCNMYEYTGKHETNIDCPYGIREIKVKDYKVVKRHHQYYATLKEITGNAKRYSTSAIYVDGQMVSWCMVHENLAMGPMFTLPEWRGKNLAVYVTNDLVGKLLAKGITPYFLIVIGNTASEKLSEKVGFKPNGVQAAWIHK